MANNLEQLRYYILNLQRLAFNARSYAVCQSDSCSTMRRYYHARPLSYHLPFITQQLSCQECYSEHQSCPHTSTCPYSMSIAQITLHHHTLPITLPIDIRARYPGLLHLLSPLQLLQPFSCFWEILSCNLPPLAPKRRTLNLLLG